MMTDPSDCVNHRLSTPTAPSKCKAASLRAALSAQFPERSFGTVTRPWTPW
jgi:hypothetical protein